MTSSIPLPATLRSFFDRFPLYRYPPLRVELSVEPSKPSLWVLPPKEPQKTNLSSDIDCLKWQGYLALRGIPVTVQWNIAVDGGLDGRLPLLQLPGNELLSADMILSWVDGELKRPAHEGYRDEETKGESHAWTSLLEGVIRAVMITSRPPGSLFSSILYAPPQQRLSTVLTPPPAPASGLTSLFPTFGVHTPTSTMLFQFREAISSLSDRLGTDKWFLGSLAPTALDALLFAYIYCALEGGTDDIKREINRRANLVAYARRIERHLQNAIQNV